MSASDHDEDDNLYKLSVTIASSHLGRHSRSSLDKLRAEAESEAWTKALFNALRSSHEHWQIRNQEELLSEYDYMGEGLSASSAAKETSTDRMLVPSVRGRNGKVLELQSLSGRALIPLRGARAGTFQLSMSNDGTTDRVKRAALAKNGVRRRAIVADCRGRMIIAEPCSLLFCVALPSVNVRYEDTLSELPCARGKMGILGSSSMKFSIVGMDLCRENERHLAVWGTAEASVVILSDKCDKAENTIELSFVLEADELDYLVKCAWLPGSQTMLAVVCGLFVKIFDIRLAEDDKVSPLVSYTLAYEALIRDTALVPVFSSKTDTSEREIISDTRRTIGKTVKLFLTAGHWSSVRA